ncbi:MAG: pyridoxamine 5'-phosphate oxidase [Alphaproteobacteria bacterium]|nr:pyridoxamine 5'-phosphate oxidase [Alphaproteobacteria bacterium]
MATSWRRQGVAVNSPPADPFSQLEAWFALANERESVNPTAAALATVRADGGPAVRMVLIKGVGPKGLDFYTNLNSRKAAELGRDPRAALTMYWKSLGRQVRVEGRVAPVEAGEADSYFASRPRTSQLGAWASRQSDILPSRQALDDAFAEVTTGYANRPVPRPPFWSGFRLAPDMIEFWTERPSRLHDRLEFRRVGGAWVARALYP